MIFNRGFSLLIKCSFTGVITAVVFCGSLCFNLHVCKAASLPILDFYNEKAIAIALEPVNRIRKELERAAISSGSFEANNVETVFESSKDFKWVFNAKGISLTEPAVDKNAGTVFVPETEIDFKVNLKKGTFLFENPRSSLYALNPELSGSKRRLLAKKGLQKWVAGSLEGVIAFPPQVLDDGSVFVASIAGDFDIKNKAKGEFNSRLFAFDKAGGSKWANPVEFDGELFTAQPVVGAEGSIFFTSARFPKGFKDITTEDINGVVCAVDSSSGSVKWVFDPGKAVGNGNMMVVAQPALNENEDILFVVAINPVTFEKIQGSVVTTIKQTGDSGAELISSATGNVLDAIGKGESFDSIVNKLETDLQGELKAPANALIDDLLKMTTLFALNSQSGEVKWQSLLHGIGFSSPVLIDSETVSVAGANFSTDVGVNVEVEQVDFDAADPQGSINFTYLIGLEFNAGSMTTNFGSIAGLSVNDGNVLWAKNINEPVYHAPVLLPDSGNIIVGASSFKTKSGDAEKELSPMIEFKSKLYAIDKKDGDVKWETEQFDGLFGTVEPNLINRSVIVAGSNGSIYFPLLNRKSDGETKTTATTTIQAVKPDGSLQWSKPFTTEGLLTAAPVLDEKMSTVLFGMVDNSKSGRGKKKGLKSKFIGIRQSDGQVFKTVDIDGAPISSVAVDEDRGAAYSATSNFKVNKKSSVINFSTLVHAIELN